MSVFRETLFPSLKAPKVNPKAVTTQKVCGANLGLETTITETGASNEIQGQGEPVEKKRLFYPHLKEYALVSSTISTVDQFPYVHDFSSKWCPVLEAAIATQPIKFFVDSFDPVGNASLNIIDKVAPSLKTLEVVDLSDPIISRVNASLATVEKSYLATTGFIDDTFINPALKTSNDARLKIIATMTDDNGKCIIAAPFDPIIGPINQNLESLVDTYLPGTKKVPKEGQSSELSRTWMVIMNVLFRAREPQVVSVEVGPGLSSQTL